MLRAFIIAFCLLLTMPILAIACHHDTPHGQNTDCGTSASTESFFVGHDGTGRTLIATFETLSVFLDCKKNNPSGFDSLTIVFENTTDNWFAANDQGLRLLTDKVVTYSTGNANTGTIFYLGNLVSVSALSNLGDLLSLQNVALGLNILTFDCAIMGQVVKIPSLLP